MFLASTNLEKETKRLIESKYKYLVLDIDVTNKDYAITYITLDLLLQNAEVRQFTSVMENKNGRHIAIFFKEVQCSDKSIVKDVINKLKRLFNGMFFLIRCIGYDKIRFLNGSVEKEIIYNLKLCRLISQGSVRGWYFLHSFMRFMSYQSLIRATIFVF